MSTNNSQSTSKSYQKFKMRRKMREDDLVLEPTETDFILEHEGDVRKFLSTTHNKFKPKLFSPSGDVLVHSVIGPISLLTKDKDLSLQPKPIQKKKKKEDRIDPKLQYTQMLNKISTSHQSAIVEERRKMRNLSQRQQLAENRCDQMLKTFEKQVNYWKGLEKNISVKSKRSSKDRMCLTSSSFRKVSKSPEKSEDSGIYSRLMWNMKLREDQNDKKYEAYLKVGNEVGGLYTRIQVRNQKGNYFTENRKEDVQVSEEDLNELRVIGVSKLPLEIEAVNNLGYEYLRPELLDSTQLEEEVIEVNYDLKAKARLL